MRAGSARPRPRRRPDVLVEPRDEWPGGLELGLDAPVAGAGVEPAPQRVSAVERKPLQPQPTDPRVVLVVVLELVQELKCFRRPHLRCLEPSVVDPKLIGIVEAGHGEADEHGDVHCEHDERQRQDDQRAAAEVVAQERVLDQAGDHDVGE